MFNNPNPLNIEKKDAKFFREHNERVDREEAEMKGPIDKKLPERLAWLKELEDLQMNMESVQAEIESSKSDFDRRRLVTKLDIKTEAFDRLAKNYGKYVFGIMQGKISGEYPCFPKEKHKMLVL